MDGASDGHFSSLDSSASLALGADGAHADLGALLDRLPSVGSGGQPDAARCASPLGRMTSYGSAVPDLAPASRLEAAGIASMLHSIWSSAPDLQQQQQQARGGRESAACSSPGRPADGGLPSPHPSPGSDTADSVRRSTLSASVWACAVADALSV